MRVRLVVYARTSTHNGGGTDSLDAQEEACRTWASGQGHDVVAVFRDHAISGGVGIEGRQGLEHALLSIEQRQADGIVVHRLDRLARELHVQEVVLSHAWNLGDRVEVFEAAEGGRVKRDDPADPHRRFLRQVMGAAAELERGLIRARLHGGRRRKARQGGYVGGRQLHRRYGYRLVEGQYQPVDDEQAVIHHILFLRDALPKPTPWAGIARMLNDQGVKPPSGESWYPMTTRRIAKREALILDSQRRLQVAR